MKLRTSAFLFGCVLSLILGPIAVLPAYAETPCTITATVVNKSTGAVAKDAIWIVYEWDPVSSHWDYAAQGGVDVDGKITAQVYHPSTAGKAILVIHGRDSYANYAYKDISPADLYDDWIAPFPSVENTKSYATATRITVTSGATVSLGTLKLTPKAAPAPGQYGAIRGRVTEGYSGKALQASVTAYRKEGSGDWYLKKTAQTAADGTYVLEGTASVPLTGEIRVVMTPQVTGGYPRAYADADSVWSARSLFIAPNTTVYGVDQSITITGRLSGSVIAAETKTPLFDAAVNAYFWDATHADWICTYPDDTDRSGRYVMPSYYSMPANTYRIGAFDRSRIYPETFYGQATSVGKAADVPLDAGGVVDGLDIYMSNRPAVAGCVANDFGTPLPDILAEVYRLEADTSWKCIGSDYTDQRGRYSIVCPSAGTYTVRYVDQAGTDDTADDAAIYLGGVTAPESATRLTVAAGRATVVGTVRVTPVDDARASRVWGNDRYATAIAASRSTFPSGETTCVVLATGEDFPDALCASGLAGAVQGPVLLTRKESLYRGLHTEFDRLGVETVYLLGSPAAISSAQEGLIRALGYEVERISGPNRYATCAAVAGEVAEVSGVDAETPVFITRGDQYPDALVVAPAAYAADGVVLLVASSYTPAPVASAIDSLGLESGFAVGGANVLPASVLAGVEAAGLSVERIAGGFDRYETAVQFAAAAEARGWLDDVEVGLAVGTNFADALGAGAALGSRGSMMFLTAPTSLTPVTGDAIAARSAGIAGLSVYGSPSAVSSLVLVQVGSR